MNNIKVMSTTYPENQPTEQEWFKEFNVGLLTYDRPNSMGVSFNDHIRHMKALWNEGEMEKKSFKFFWQTNS